MTKKLRVGVLFGGRSGEHEVSLLSAASILKAIDRKKFDVVPIGITKEGHWLAAGDARNLLEGDTSAVARRLRAGDPEATPGAKLLHEGIPTLLVPEPGAGVEGAGHVCGCRSGHAGCGVSGSPRYLRRGRHHPGPLRTRRHRLCRLGRAGLLGGHGQGRDEAALRPGRAPHREARDPAALRLGEVAAQGHRASRSARSNTRSS